MSRTAEDKAQDYTAMGHSVNLINGIIGETKMVDDTAEDKNKSSEEKTENRNANGRTSHNYRRDHRRTSRI